MFTLVADRKVNCNLHLCFAHFSNGCHIEINLCGFLIPRQLVEGLGNPFGNNRAVFLADFDQHDNILPNVVSGVKIPLSYGGLDGLSKEFGLFTFFLFRNVIGLIIQCAKHDKHR